LTPKGLDQVLILALGDNNLRPKGIRNRFSVDEVTKMPTRCHPICQQQRSFNNTWIVFGAYYVTFRGLLLYLDSFRGLLHCFSGIITVPGLFSGIVTTPLISLGIITTPLICLGIITVLIFGDYYVAFWGLLLSSISGIIQATHIV
jgi:hypothetical protein